MDRQQIDDYVTRSRQIVERSPEMNEETTKVRLVQPFLELLGWDCHSTEVELEYTVPMASGRTRVDYALLVEDSPVVFVEAKAARSALTDENVRQLQSYMRQELAVDWGIVTNGRTVEILTKRAHEHDSGESSLGRLSLGDLRDADDVLQLLTKRSIASGRAGRLANAVGEPDDPARRLVARERSISASVAAAIRTETGPLPVDLDGASREFVRDLTTSVREQTTDGDRATPQTKASGLDEWRTDSDTDRSTTASARGRRDGPHDTSTAGESSYRLRLSDGTLVPDDNDDDRTHVTQRQNMTETVDLLFSEYDLAAAIDYPYTVPDAPGRCTINVVARHPDGTAMKDPHELPDGTVLRTLLGTDGKQARLRSLARRVDLSVEFLGKWCRPSANVLDKHAAGSSRPDRQTVDFRTLSR
jgi:hypothetical protein